MSVILVLSSVTYALKAQDLLKNEGIYSTITRSPAVKAIKGCGYGIKIPYNQEIWAKQILLENGISILGCVIE
ncbi:MAG: hypothetical protein A2Y15_06150 [Clostridiales bacterium GWF2_36_10]|nr:MAG: hypothetical protein A2Y15_06150 [Clostridiales bacterium GWF2_36_10]